MTLETRGGRLQQSVETLDLYRKSLIMRKASLIMYSGPLHAGTAPRLSMATLHMAASQSHQRSPLLPNPCHELLQDLPDRLPAQWPIHRQMLEQHIATSGRHSHVG